MLLKRSAGRDLALQVNTSSKKSLRAVVIIPIAVLANLSRLTRTLPISRALKLVLGTHQMIGMAVMPDVEVVANLMVSSRKLKGVLWPSCKKKVCLSMMLVMAIRFSIPGCNPAQMGYIYLLLDALRRSSISS